MRLTALAFAVAILVAGCGQGAPGAGGAGGGSVGNIFPDLFQTAYRAEANIRNPENGELMPVVMIRSGQKMRMEISAGGGDAVIISNAETGETLMISEAQGRQIAIRQSDAGSFEAPEDMWRADTEGSTYVGPCTHIGETGAEWRRIDDGGDTNVGCISQDGIILWASTNDQRTWETTSIARGPQPEALFALPPGVEVMDLGNMADMIERARANAGQ